MKITLTWTPTGAAQPTNFVLADSPAAIPLTNFRINGSRQIQEARFFRATAAQFFIVAIGARKSLLTRRGCFPTR